jgi:hypothetical protein
LASVIRSLQCFLKSGLFHYFLYEAQYYKINKKMNKNYIKDSFDNVLMLEKTFLQAQLLRLFEVNLPLGLDLFGGPFLEGSYDLLKELRV